MTTASGAMAPRSIPHLLPTPVRLIVVGVATRPMIVDHLTVGLLAGEMRPHPLEEPKGELAAAAADLKVDG